MNVPHIKNAYESVRNACCQKVQELYPHGVPSLVQERLDTELCYLLKSVYTQDDYEIYRQLCIEARKCCQYFTLPHFLSGSYLLYLMGDGRYNPLPTHYYCSVCGHFEAVETQLYGIDLPDRSCPDCGSPMSGDGFRLDVESVFTPDGNRMPYFEYHISDSFRPFVFKVLTRLYPDNVIVPSGTWEEAPGDNPYDLSCCKVVPSGFVILPSGHTLDDYAELKTYLEDGTPCIDRESCILGADSPKAIGFLTRTVVDKLLLLQQKTGTYIHEIGLKELHGITYYDMVNSYTLHPTEVNLFQENKPRNFTEMVHFHAMSRNSCKAPDPRHSEWSTDIGRLMASPEYAKYPCATREDLYELLLACSNTQKYAFAISDSTRKGRFRWFEDHYRDSAAEYILPSELRTLAMQYTYMAPRAHCVERSLLNARMAYYMKLDGRVYHQIMEKRKG